MVLAVTLHISSWLPSPHPSPLSHCQDNLRYWPFQYISYSRHPSPGKLPPYRRQSLKAFNKKTQKTVLSFLFSRAGSTVTQQTRFIWKMKYDSNPKWACWNQIALFSVCFFVTNTAIYCDYSGLATFGQERNKGLKMKPACLIFGNRMAGSSRCKNDPEMWHSRYIFRSRRSKIRNSLKRL